MAGSHGEVCEQVIAKRLTIILYYSLEDDETLAF
jgi:hypothetical protein